MEEAGRPLKKNLVGIFQEYEKNLCRIKCAYLPIAMNDEHFHSIFSLKLHTYQEL